MHQIRVRRSHVLLVTQGLNFRLHPNTYQPEKEKRLPKLGWANCFVKFCFRVTLEYMPWSSGVVEPRGGLFFSKQVQYCGMLARMPRNLPLFLAKKNVPRTL